MNTIARRGTMTRQFVSNPIWKLYGTDVVGPLDPRLFSVRCRAALEDCNKALQLKPDDGATYDSRGLIYLKMGQLDAAIDDYNSALRFEPKLASALYGRGLAKLGRGDKTGGDTDISTAKTIQADIGDDFMRYGVQ